MMSIMLGNTNNLSLIYVIIMNIFGFFCIFLDKRYARLKQYRISENFLFGLSLLGGSIGIYLGMICIRHKTKKLKFSLGLPLIIIIQSLYLIKIV